MPDNIGQSGHDTTRMPWRECAFIPVPRTADVLGISSASVYGLEAKGELSFRRVGGRTLVAVDSLSAYIDKVTKTAWTPSDRGKQARAARARVSF
ncbi:helix-turn-helix domain-containing protein [Cereibacter johrii]|uniref:helix-turn-helix domain-containing protein n=1 Tax=Cereibacter johrii TaxID=445629 RepID=UPI000DCB9A33|nr:helix-turn-helix domain-containing protein [Cereibacter johrii]RAZ83505.1 hypothetical protein DDV93_14465 [Cereibacter johrii]